MAEDAQGVEPEATGLSARGDGVVRDEAAMLALAGAFARSLAAHLDQPRLITLHGDLGAGKTTFVRGLLRGLGHQAAVRSPTFTLVEPYRLQLPGSGGWVEVRHFDLYRLADPEEFEYLGERDHFLPGVIWVVEWPERGLGALPTADLALTLSVPSEAHHAHARRLRATGPLAGLWMQVAAETLSPPE